MASDATGEGVQTTACDATDAALDKDSVSKETNGGIPKKPDSEKEVSKKKDEEKDETEGLVMDCLRSPRQTRVRRISAELRLSASSSVENIKKAGKGFSSGLQNVANKLPVPRSLQRRSRSYENLEENSLLHPDTPKADGGDDIRKSKSTENLKKIKDDKDDASRGDKRFLRRKWEARKSRQQQENKSDEKPEKTEETFSDDAPQDDGLAVDSIPIVFEPLTLGQRPLTPTVTICLTDDENRNTNPFLD